MKEQSRKLEEENRQLHGREAILLAYYQTLSWLRQLEIKDSTVLAGVEMEQQQQQQDRLLLASSVGSFSEQELLLLQQLQTKLTKQSASHTDIEPALWQVPKQQQQQQQLELQQGCNTGNGNASAGRQQSGSSDGKTSGDSSGRAPAPSAAAAAAAAGPVPQQEPTIAPDDDLLYYFRRIFSMPRYPGAEDMTMQDASDLYNEVVRELSLNLALLEAAQRQLPGKDGVPGWRLAGVKPWQNIRAALERLSNSFLSLGHLNSSIHMGVVLVNHADLSQPLLPEPSLEDHIRCVRQIGLSDKQKQQIADGYAVFSKLLQPVLLSMRQLQLQQPGDTAASACSSSFATLSLEGYKMHREDLHQQEQRVAQMSKLMHKDWTIKAAFCAHLTGRCTYTQLARLYVLMYPRQPAIGALGRAVDVIWKEDLARQSRAPGAQR
ncbi:hypothetical protein OEZ85_002264 [Tetradesmus obliquus]|uniref:Uncharacterized protein n=1 Tax=Tetradesmus obliquus TaxID=3088 RepID=A0ABY8U2F8_TETOB|nr:hypothetical protein OEZ85_002264 [Tetradesmus obliquus]